MPTGEGIFKFIIKVFLVSFVSFSPALFAGCQESEAAVEAAFSHDSSLSRIPKEDIAHLEAAAKGAESTGDTRPLRNELRQIIKAGKLSRRELEEYLATVAAFQVIYQWGADAEGFDVIKKSDWREMAYSARVWRAYQEELLVAYGRITEPKVSLDIALKQVLTKGDFLELDLHLKQLHRGQVSSASKTRWQARIQQLRQYRDQIATKYLETHTDENPSKYFLVVPAYSAEDLVAKLDSVISQISRKIDN